MQGGRDPWGFGPGGEITGGGRNPWDTGLTYLLTKLIITEIINIIIIITTTTTIIIIIIIIIIIMIHFIHHILKIYNQGPTYLH